MNKVIQSCLDASGAITKKALLDAPDYIFTEDSLSKFVSGIVDYHSALARLYAKDNREDPQACLVLKYLSQEFSRSLK
jgi:hypothetical protein